jgi:glutaredoxin
MDFEKPKNGEITVYSKSGCSGCSKVKTLLKQKNLLFTVIDCDEYILENKSYLENLKIIKPNKIIHDNKVLFSNISLCKNKIIMTSTCYLYTPWNFDNLKINIYDNKIIKKNIYNYEHYESSLSVIIELEYNNLKESIEIIYDNKIYKIELEQLNLKD